MSFVVGLIIVVFIGWLWKNRQYDKETILDFDTWLHRYDTTDSASKRTGMAIAFLHQSIHIAWTMGAINSKQREKLTDILKAQGATTSMTMWLGSVLPVAIRVVGERDLADLPARVVGMLLLLGWMSETNEREDVIRNFYYSPTIRR